MSVYRINITVIPKTSRNWRSVNFGRNTHWLMVVYFSIIIIHMKLSFRHPTAPGFVSQSNFLGSWTAIYVTAALILSCTKSHAYKIIWNSKCYERNRETTAKFIYIYYYTDTHHNGHMPENCVQPLLISFILCILCTLHNI